MSSLNLSLLLSPTPTQTRNKCTPKYPPRPFTRFKLTNPTRACYPFRHSNPNACHLASPTSTPTTSTLMLPKQQCQQLNSAPGSTIHVLEKDDSPYHHPHRAHLVGFCLGIRDVRGAGVPRGIWEFR